LSSQAIYSALKADDCKVAEKLLERMDSSFGPRSLMELSEYYFLKTRLAIFRGYPRTAPLHAAEASLNSLIEVGSPFFLGLRYLSKAHVAYELGRHRHAQECCAHALSIARKTQNVLLTFSVFLAEAFFALDQGKELNGLQLLRKALDIGNSQGYLNTFQDNPPLHLEKWPCALKIYTLGRFVVLRNGQPIRFSRKAQQKPLSMLKALIAFGGREVRKDQIADALWPEADGDMVEQSFATTLHRLRKVIGYRNAIELQHERLTLDRQYSWVDVWAFERIFGQADSAWEKRTDGTGSDGSRCIDQKGHRHVSGTFSGRRKQQPVDDFPSRTLPEQVSAWCEHVGPLLGKGRTTGKGCAMLPARA